MVNNFSVMDCIKKYKKVKLKVGKLKDKTFKAHAVQKAYFQQKKNLNKAGSQHRNTNFKEYI